MELGRLVSNNDQFLQTEIEQIEFEMAHFKDAALEHELKRWMRPDAHRFVRPDWRRFVRPGFEKDHPFALYERKYRSDQLRDDRGRWADEGGGQETGAEDQLPINAKPAHDTARRSAGANSQETELADLGFGRLIAELPGPGGRRCVYQFGTLPIMIPGPVNFRCPTTMHWGGTTHGGRLNDN
jgi:hypothetical protein